MVLPVTKRMREISYATRVDLVNIRACKNRSEPKHVEIIKEDVTVGMSAGWADGDWVLGKDSLGGGGEVIDLIWSNNEDNKSGYPTF